MLPKVSAPAQSSKSIDENEQLNLCASDRKPGNKGAVESEANGKLREDRVVQNY